MGSSATRHDMTLGQVVGIGLCLLGPHIFPHLPLLIPVTNFLLSITAQFIVAPNLIFFACSTGLFPHVIVIFHANKDYSVLVVLMPKLTVRPETDLLPRIADFDSLHRHRREPVTALTLALLVGLGAIGAGTGIYSLVHTQDPVNALTRTVVKRC